MSDGQVVFLFCLIYSGALSLVIWANLVTRARIAAHIAEDKETEAGEGQFKKIS